MSVAPLLDMRRTALFAATALTLSTGLAACTGSDLESGDPEDGVFVDDSKADDFLSASAQEYILIASTSVTIDAALASATPEQRLAEAKKLIGLKHIAVAWFLTQYLVDKEEDSPNHAFGGLGGMAKGGAYEELEIRERADKITFDYKVRQIAAGGRSLMQKLPIRVVDGKQVFDLEIGRPTNAEMAQLEMNNEWYRRAPWNAWNPANVAAENKETLTFQISRERPSEDGFFDIQRLAADGKIDIDVHFGWDYHAAFHLAHSKEVFTWLKQQGFAAPVTTWEGLTHTTGPFRRNVIANGRTIKVEVRLLFGKPGTPTDPDTDAGGVILENAARESLRTRDVIMYSGHSGNFYGFALANWKKTSEGDLDDDEIRTAEMPRDRYQVVLAEGCDTYAMAAAFKDNPAKMGRHVDVVTTTSFSDAGSAAAVKDFISAILARDASGRLRPQPVSSLLTKLDSNSWSFETLYGMHGIDDNPKLVPFANVAAFGRTCNVNNDCGGPGNLCIAAAASQPKKCTAACTAAAGCGAGFTCKSVASSSAGTIYGRACAKL